MLKTKKITALICILLALILLSSNAVFADESSEDKPGEVFDSSDISEDKLYTMQRGEFTKEVTSGACSVAYLCIKELYFNTKEAKFIKYHVETGETVERGQMLASFNIPSSDSELTKRSLAIASQQEKMQSGLEKYDEKIAVSYTHLRAHET